MISVQEYMNPDIEIEREKLSKKTVFNIEILRNPKYKGTLIIGRAIKKRINEIAIN